MDADHKNVTKALLQHCLSFVKLCILLNNSPEKFSTYQVKVGLDTYVNISHGGVFI